MLRNWRTVFLGNFGSILLARLIFLRGFYPMGDNALGFRLLTIANGKLNIGFKQLVARGIVCNWLVYLAFWIATSDKDTTGKILACFLPIMTFARSQLRPLKT